MADIGRNEPCPCGSGKKYKRCCGAGSAETSLAQRAQSTHGLDKRLVDDIEAFARRRFGTQWYSDVVDTYFDDFPREEYEVQLLVPWAMYHFETGGRTAAELFLAERGRRLPDDVRAWLDAQFASWLSVWEVQRVDAGVGLAVKDLLTGVERYAYEVKGTKTLKARDTMLGRVVEAQGVCVFCGMHPRTLSPFQADFVVRQARRRARKRTRPIEVEKLRSMDDTLALIDDWHLMVEESLRRPLPQLANTDGDPVLLTTDVFDFDARTRAEVIVALEALEGAQEAIEEDGEADVTFIKSGNAKTRAMENTVVGSARVGVERLLVEANSTKRADLLRQRVEAGLGPLVRHRIRQHADPEAWLAEPGSGAPDKPEEPMPPEVAAALKAFRERYMAAWVDESIPALDGLTPREAAKQPAGRKKLDLLLRDMEHMEARQPEAERLDFGQLRRELGLG